MQYPTPTELDDMARKFLDDKAAQLYHARIFSRPTRLRYDTYLTYYTTVFGLTEGTYNVMIEPAAFPDHATIRSVLDKSTSDPSQDRLLFRSVFAAPICQKMLRQL